MANEGADSLMVHNAAEEQGPRGVTMRDLFYGGVSLGAHAILLAVVGNPFDNYRSLLHLGPDLKVTAKDAVGPIISYRPLTLYSSLKSAGALRVLMRGAGVHVVKEILKQVFLPYSVDLVQNLSKRFDNRESESRLAGAVRRILLATSATVLVSVVVMPFENIKLRLLALSVPPFNTQEPGASAKNVIDVFNIIVREGGYPALWRGCLVHALRSFVFNSLYFAIDAVLPTPKTFWQCFARMGGSMLCTNVVAYPLDSLMKRTAIGGLDKPEWTYFKYLATNRCPFHFWNGFSTDVVTIALQAFLASAVFEQQLQQ